MEWGFEVQKSKILMNHMIQRDMETKHTKEYAEKFAKEFYPCETTDLICSPKLVRDGYTNGYMKAIEETAAPELLEALILVKYWAKEFGLRSDVYEKVTNAIKKATT